MTRPVIKLTRKTLRLAMEKWYCDDIVGLIRTMQALGLGEMDARQMIFGQLDFGKQNWAIRCLQATTKKEFILVGEKEERQQTAPQGRENQQPEWWSESEYDTDYIPGEQARP